MNRTRRRWRVVKWAALVVGLALLNWPAGWLLVSWPHETQTFWALDDEAAAIGWPTAVPSDWPAPRQINVDTGFGFEWSFASHPNQTKLGEANAPPLRTATRRRGGSPMLAVESAVLYGPGLRGPRPIGNAVFGFSIQWRGWNEGILLSEIAPPRRIFWLPMRPFPLGLIANTASMLAIVLAGRFAWCRLPRPAPAPMSHLPLRPQRPHLPRLPRVRPPIPPKPSANETPSNSTPGAVH